MACITELVVKIPSVQGLVLLQVAAADLERQVQIVTSKKRALLPAASALCHIVRDKAIETASASRAFGPSAASP